MRRLMPKVPLALGAGVVVLYCSRSGYVSFIATAALTWGLVGIGLAVLTGWGNQISLAQGAFFGVGATTAVLFSRHHLPFLLGLATSVLIGAILGLLAGLPSLRLRGSFLAVATLAVQFMIQGTVFRWRYVTDESASFVRRPAFASGDFSYFLLAAVTTLLFAVGVSRLAGRRTGWLLRGLKGSGLELQATGHSLPVYRLMAGAIATTCTVVAGALFAGLLTRVSYFSFGFSASVQFLTGAVLGGIGSVTGAFAGLAAASLLPEALRFTPIDPAYNAFVLGGIALVVLWIEPGGLAALGRKLRSGPMRTRRRPADISIPEGDAGPAVPEHSLEQQSVGGLGR